jgi:hypothetical protein
MNSRHDNTLYGNAVMNCLTSKTFGDEVNVACPYCHGDYTHIHHAGTLTGSDEHEAVTAYDGTFQSGSTGDRRSALEVVFYCEDCPTLFALVFQQHKGVNFVRVHTHVGFKDEAAR